VAVVLVGVLDRLGALGHHGRAQPAAAGARELRGEEGLVEDLIAFDLDLAELEAVALDHRNLDLETPLAALLLLDAEDRILEQDVLVARPAVEILHLHHVFGDRGRVVDVALEHPPGDCLLGLAHRPLQAPVAVDRIVGELDVADADLLGFVDRETTGAPWEPPLRADTRPWRSGSPFRGTSPRWSSAGA
jgi:hypothetical protein